MHKVDYKFVEKYTRSQNELRCDMKKKLDDLDTCTIDLQSKKLCEKLITLICHNKWTHIACFMPLKTSKIREIDLTYLINELKKNDKIIYKPSIDRVSDEMYFIPVDDIIDMNITTNFEIIKNLDLVICPGIVFNQKGHRIGRGKGYYDKALTFCKTINSKLVTIGVGFDAQNFDYEWDLNFHDVAMDYVMFPSSMIGDKYKLKTNTN